MQDADQIQRTCPYKGIPSNGELKVWVDALPNERNPVTVISTAWSERQ